MKKSELKSFLDFKTVQYNTPEFIDSDPIQIPHQFTKKEDIEIAAFLTATIAWGNRKSILKNANQLMDLLDRSPYDFVMCHKEYELENLRGFVHRTFNENDLLYFISGLKNIYTNHGGLEAVFTKNAQKDPSSQLYTSLKKCFSTFLISRAHKSTLVILLKIQQQKELICSCVGW